jgi:hypothetical protein
MMWSQAARHPLTTTPFPDRTCSPPPTTNIADDSSVAALMQELEDWLDTVPRSKKKKDPPPAQSTSSVAPKPAPVKGRDPDFDLAGVGPVSSSAMCFVRGLHW